MKTRLRRQLVIGAVVAASLTVGAAAAPAGGPVTKQNGRTPVFDAFTSICAVDGYAWYGNCGGDETTYTDVKGRIDAVQPKPGVYSLEFTFSGLTPGTVYRLHGNDGSFFRIGDTAADELGVARFSYRTSAPAGLGFDLNILSGDITVVTSYWSNQLLAVRSDGTLFVP